MAKYRVMFAAAGQIFTDIVEADGVEWSEDNTEGLRFYEKAEDVAEADNNKQEVLEATIAFYPCNVLVNWREIPEEKEEETKQQPGDFLAWLADGKKVSRRNAISEWFCYQGTDGLLYNMKGDCLTLGGQELFYTDWFIVEVTVNAN